MASVWVVEVEHTLDRYRTRAAICGTYDRAVDYAVTLGDICGIVIDRAVFKIANMYSHGTFIFHVTEEELL